MERDVTIGDNVIISLNNSFKNYTIFKIDKEVIFITSEDPNFLGAIVFENDIWKVYNTDTPYEIEFVAKTEEYLPQLTGNINVDNHVVEYLGRDNLRRCGVSTGEN